MNPEFLSTRAYDLIADRWSDASFNPHNGIAQHQHALKFLADSTPGWVLNVGCGCNTRFNPLFRASGLTIEGVDLSARMVELARAADPTALVHHADICSWPLPRLPLHFCVGQHLACPARRPASAAGQTHGSTGARRCVPVHRRWSRYRQ